MLCRIIHAKIAGHYFIYMNENVIEISTAAYSSNNVRQKQVAPMANPSKNILHNIKILFFLSIKLIVRVLLAYHIDYYIHS